MWVISLSGAKHLHHNFWRRRRAHIKLEDEVFIEAANARILGRGHRIKRSADFTTPLLDMSSFAQQVVDACCELADLPKERLKKVATPCLSEALMSDDDIHHEGALSEAAAKALMKTLWLGRFARHDLCFIIGRLASRVACWTRWEGKQLLRMMSYLHGSIDTCLAATVCHHDTPKLCIFTDSDFSPCPRTAKSISGIYITVGSTEFGFPLWLSSKKRTQCCQKHA